VTSASTLRLVATDLDGTLLRSDESLSPRTRAALERAVASGAVHVIVTGRSVETAGPVFDELHYDGLAVCGQGAQLYDAGAHELIAAHTVDAKAVQPVLARLAETIGPVRIAVARAGIAGGFHGPPGMPWPWELVPLNSVTESELWDEPVMKAFLNHERLSVDELAAAVRAVGNGLFEAVNAGGDLVELVPAGVTKATGLAEVAERLGLTAAETIAFGDMPSDVPMLIWAGWGVAMANGHLEAIAAADEVAPSNDEDGVAVVLERVYRGSPVRPGGAGGRSDRARPTSSSLEFP
jgi:Cof subfamily protein (haloacid dehalogenase superfamily)